MTPIRYRNRYAAADTGTPNTAASNNKRTYAGERSTADTSTVDGPSGDAGGGEPGAGGAAGSAIVNTSSAPSRARAASTRQGTRPLDTSTARPHGATLRQPS